MGFDQFPIAPQTDEEKKDCETPDGVRRRLRKVYYHHSDPIVHHIMRAAEARGMSGEDMYAVMAFEALKQLEAVKARYIDVLNTLPGPAFMKATQPPTSSGSEP
jgi:hypothetical protein